jgi:hypothetical protein
MCVGTFACAGAEIASGAALGSLVARMPNLTFLDVSGNPLGEDGLRALSAGMQAHARLRHVLLAGCGVAVRPPPKAPVRRKVWQQPAVEVGADVLASLCTL